MTFNSAVPTSLTTLPSLVITSTSQIFPGLEGVCRQKFISRNTINLLSDIRLNDALTRFLGKWNSLTRSVESALLDNVFNFMIAREVE